MTMFGHRSMSGHQGLVRNHPNQITGRHVPSLWNRVRSSRDRLWS